MHKPSQPPNLLDYLDDLDGLPEQICVEKINNLPIDAAQKQVLLRCIAAKEKSRGFMAQCPTLVDGLRPAQDGLSDAPSDHKRTPHDRGPGEVARLGHAGGTFGKYRLHRFLASGTFGEVWSAKHHWLDTSEAKPTCLKLLYPENTQLDAALGEARLMAAVHHPNVVAVKEVDCAQLDGQIIWYIEMEFIGGKGAEEDFAAAPSLQAIGTKDGRPTFAPAKAARIMLGICDGVHAAHQRQLVHRDLKPENILLDPQSQQPKVADFGIAGSLRQADDGAKPTSRKTLALGTPAYMSPEQAAGDISIQADIYALGAILYFLLSGRPPYRARAGLTGTAAAMDVLGQVRSGVGPAPLPDNLRIPPTLRAICEKAMSHTPASRYASADQMAQDIHAWLGRRPTVAYPLTTIQAAALFAMRYPKETIFSFSMALLLTGGTLFYVHRINIQKKFAQHEAAIATLAARQAIEARRKAEHEATVAIRARRESRQRAYRAGIGAAENALFSGDFSTGRSALRQTPKVYRGWEYYYLRRALGCSARMTAMHGRILSLQWLKRKRVFAALTGQYFTEVGNRQPIATPTECSPQLIPVLIKDDPVNSSLALALVTVHGQFAAVLVSGRNLKQAGINRLPARAVGRERLAPFCWSPHGRRVAIVGPRGRTIRICTVPDLRPVQRVALPDYRATPAGDGPATWLPPDAAGIQWLSSNKLIAIGGNLAVMIHSHAGGHYAPAHAGWQIMFPDSALILGAAMRPSAAVDQPMIAFGLADGTLVVKSFLSDGTGPYFYTMANPIPLEAVAWSPDGHTLYSGSRDGIVIRYGFHPLKYMGGEGPAFIEKGYAFGVMGPVQQLFIGDNGAQIAAADRHGNAYVWRKSEFNIQGKATIQRLTLRNSARKSRDAEIWKCMVTRENGGEILLTTQMMGTVIAGGYGRSFAFGGRAGKYAGSIFTFDPATGNGGEIFGGLPHLGLFQLCAGGNGTVAALYHKQTVDAAGGARLVLIHLLQPKQTEVIALPDYFSSVAGVSISANGKYWMDVSGHDMAWGTTYNAPGGRNRGASARPTYALGVIPAGHIQVSQWTGPKAVAVGGLYRGHAAVFFFTLPMSTSRRSDRLGHKLMPSAPPAMLDQNDWVTAMATDPSSDTVIVGTENGYLWRVTAGEKPTLLKATPGSSIQSIAFDGNLNRYAEISQSGTLRIWKPGTRHAVLLLNNLQVRGHGVAWCAKGRLVIASSMPGLYILNGSSKTFRSAIKIQTGR